MKIKIKIQSISDIITNSSSEVFCTVTSELYLDEVKNLLRTIFPGEDSELEPTIETTCNAVTLWMPYGQYGMDVFYREGLKAILDKYFNENYEIVFQDTVDE